MDREQLEGFLRDSRWEDEWRAEADKAAAYYDGLQLDAPTLQKMQDRGLAPLVRNLIAPTINLLLGMEAKAKRDWRAYAEQDADTEVASALSQKLKQYDSMCGGDRACSDAYASMVKTGVGWVEVARESNPFRPPYRLRAVHRREIYWDFRSKEPDLSDARYLVRKQWVDEDVAILHFPKKASVLKRVMSLWADWDSSLNDEADTGLMQAYNAQLSSSLDPTDWFDADRRRLCLYEVWYRDWTSGVVMKLPDGRVLEVDAQNPTHLALVESGAVSLFKATFPKVRLSWYAGPHFLADVPSPYRHGYFPYIPFWAYREDGNGVPYGVVRAMMSPQDEVNSRLARMMWLLSAKRIITDSDALDMPLTEVAEEAARPDAVILTNPNRKNKNPDALRVESDFALSQQQFNVLQDATRAIQDSAGIYQSMLGKSEYAGQSGFAINSLVEQGSTTVAELNDNYRYGRRLVGTLLLSYIQEDIGTAPASVVLEGDASRKTIYLNQPVTLPTGETSVTNDVVATQLRVELEDIPDTPSYRLQQFQMFSEIVKSMPPEIQPLFADFIIRASDLPFRRELADRISQKLGFSPSPEAATPEEAQQQAAQQAQQQQAAQQQQELQAQLSQLQLQEQQGKAAKAMAEAELARARAAQVGMQTAETDQRMAHSEDDHALSLDERSVALVKNLQTPPVEEASSQAMR